MVSRRVKSKGGSPEEHPDRPPQSCCIVFCIITQTIINKLDHAELVIADLTEHNPNVFFEMGYRAQTQKPIIHLKSKGEKIPFDVTTIRAFDYDLTDLDNVEQLRDRLKKTIQ